MALATCGRPGELDMRRSILAAAAATVLVGLTVAGAASAQTRIQPGQTLRGELSQRDPRMGDDSAYDCYSLQTQAGQTYTVTQRSTAFDAYMAVTPSTNCSADPRDNESNDDGPDMGTDAQITFRGTGQPWLIRANSLEGNSFGAYTIAVTASGSGPAPRAPGKPPAGGANSAPPANNNSNSDTPSRPASGEDRYNWDAMCQAADLVALVLMADQNMSDAQLTEWIETAQVLQEATATSGRAIGKTEEQINDDIATFGAAWMTDESLMRDVPPADLRTLCLAQHH